MSRKSLVAFLLSNACKNNQLNIEVVFNDIDVIIIIILS